MCFFWFGKFIFPITWTGALDWASHVLVAHQLIHLLLVRNSETDAAGFLLLQPFAEISCEGVSNMLF